MRRELVIAVIGWAATGVAVGAITACAQSVAGDASPGSAVAAGEDAATGSDGGQPGTGDDGSSSSTTGGGQTASGSGDDSGATTNDSSSPASGGGEDAAPPTSDDAGSPVQDSAPPTPPSSGVCPNTSQYENEYLNGGGMLPMCVTNGDCSASECCYVPPVSFLPAGCVAL